jgi:hypothetical protein
MVDRYDVERGFSKGLLRIVRTEFATNRGFLALITERDIQIEKRRDKNVIVPWVRVDRSRSERVKSPFLVSG